MTDEPRTVSKPDPDPTLLTTAALLREIDQLKNLTRGWVDALQLLLESRLQDLEKFFDARQSLLVERFSVVNQQFESIKVQFAERDTRTEQTAAGVKIAVDAALQAAKEAVAEQNRSFALATGKSETATMKQIDALGLAIQTANKGLDDKIADMKDRLTRIEGMDLGSARSHSAEHEGKLESHLSTQNILAILALLAAIGGWAYTAIKMAPPIPQPVVYQVPPLAPSLQHQSMPLMPSLPNFGLRVAGFDPP
jgi:hypothetical protein